MRCRLWSLGALACAASALVACNAIVGIDAPELGGGDDGGPPLVDGAMRPPPLGDGQAPQHDAGRDGADAEPMMTVDGGLPDAMADHYVVPPDNGKPGLDLTAGGTWGKSTSFSLVAATGESPGGNTVGRSTNYTLKTGVIAVGQPN